MKVKIHRGTKEIGGNCIELSSSGKSILLDLGMPLTIINQNDAKLPEIEGLKQGDNPNMLGIVISHPHQDHYGLLPKVHPDVPIFIGKDAHAILEASSPFSPFGISLECVTHYKNRIKFIIGPFQITPFLNDHSAYDAYSLLIEADGKTIFYTGDFRTHGRKAGIFKQLLETGPKNVDVLLMEGTNIGRGLKSDKPVTEDELEKDIKDVLNNTRGLVLSWFSGQNIDRFVTFYKAAKRANRTMIVDLYIAHILDAIDNPSLPSPMNSDLRVFLPSRMRNKIIREKSFDLVNRYSEKRIYFEEIKENTSKYLMTFRPIMCSDLEKADCLSDASLIYSMWVGYLDQGRDDIRDWCNQRSIKFQICHTSGHSDITGMQQLTDALSPKRLVPIHSFKPELFKNYLSNVEQMEDGQWWDV
jgi:ribonuclease J